MREKEAYNNKQVKYLVPGWIPISDALRDLVIFAQFKKREKQPWRRVNFSKVVG